MAKKKTDKWAGTGFEGLSNEQILAETAKDMLNTTGVHKMSPLTSGPMFGFFSRAREVSAEDAYRQSLIATTENMSRADATKFNDWLKNYPTMDPRTAVPLALGNIEPLSLIGQQAAKSDIAAQINDGSYGQNIQSGTNTDKGGVATQPTPDNGQAKTGEEAWWQTLADNVTPDKGTWLGDLADNVTPDRSPLGDAFSAMSRTALTGFQTGIDAWQAVARNEGGKNKAAEDIATRYGLTPAQRQWFQNQGTTGADNAPNSTEERLNIGMGAGPDLSGPDPYGSADAKTQARMNAALKDWQATDFSNEGKMLKAGVEQTAGGQVLLNEEVRNKFTSDTGSWTPPAIIEENKQVVAERVWDIRTQAEVDRGVSPQAWTPGRQVAHIWFDPDSQAYHTWSGIVDATVDLTLDPANAIPIGAAGKGARAAGALAARFAERAGAETLATRIPGSAQRAFEDTNQAIVRTNTNVSRVVQDTRRGKAATQPARDAGAQVFDDGRVTNGPWGQYVIPERAWAWLNQGRGARLVDDFANDPSWSSIRMKTGNRIDVAVAKELAAADSPEKIRAVLGSRIGKEIGSARELGTAGMAIPGVFKFGVDQGRYASRAWRAVAVGSRSDPLSLNDEDKVADSLYALAVGAGAKPGEIAPYLDAALNPQSAADKYGSIYGPDGFFAKVVAPSLVRNGVHEDDANKLVQAFEGGLDPSQRNYWNSDIAFGGGPARGSATLLGESLGDQIVLPSHREILRAGSHLSKIRKTAALGNNEWSQNIGDALDEMTSIWRQNVLIRPAYTMREVGEMAFSMSLSGYDSYFTSPIHAIALATHIASTKAMSGAAGHLSKALLSGKIDASTLRELRLERMEAKSTVAGGQRAAKGAKWAMKYGALRGSQGVGKTASALAIITGMKALHPAMDMNLARVNGDDFYAEFTRAIEEGDNSLLGPMGDALSSTHGNFFIDQYTRNYAKSVEAINRDVDPDRFARALADRLRRGSSDKDVKNLADPNMTFEDALADYVVNRSTATREMMGNSTTMKDWADPSMKSDMDYMKAQEDVIKQLTNNDPDLLDALVSGKFNDEAVDSTNKALVAHIRAAMDKDPNGFPQFLTGMIDSKSNAARGLYNKYTQMAQDFFSSTGEFSDIFARGPLVRQAYVKRVEQLAPHMTPAAKAEVVANLRNAGDIALARKVQGFTARGTLGIDEVELLAANFAKKESQRIFYDAARRQNWAYAMRVVSPFAQSTVNTFKRWGLMSMSNPQSYYRSLKPVTALMEPGSAAIYGAIDSLPGDAGAIGDLYNPERPEDSAADGFFYTDRYGERKFTYPLIGPLAKLFGADPSVWLPEGSMENLNVAGTTINPGFGPSLTLPASFVFPDVIHDDTNFGAALRLAFPYGLTSSDSSVVDKLTQGLASSWQKKTLDASDPVRMGNMSMMIIASLARSGDYDMSSTQDINRMNEDAKQMANQILLVSGVGGMFTPSTFNPKILVQVKSPQGQAAVARYMMLDKLGAEFQKYTKDDYKGGTQRFIDDYGQTALFGALPRTKTDFAIQATNDMWKFATDNPDAYQQNLEVIGLYMSGDDLGSNFAREQYAKQKASGQRTALTATEYTTKVNEAIGWNLWNQKMKEITQQFGDGTDEAASAKATVRQALEDKYPGFSPSAKDTGKNEELIAKIRDSLDNKAIQTLPSYYYVNRYMEARDAATTELRKRGGTGNLNTKGNSDIATALRSMGDQYARDDTSGGFRNMWNRVLTQELYDASQGGN